MSNAVKDHLWSFGDDIASQPVREGVSRKILSYCDALMCVENFFETGAKGHLHGHPHTQITYVAEGKFKFTIGDETRVVKKGDAMLKQDGIVHGCECLEKGILVDLFTPMREDFV
ncbi:MAG: cupin domain-containing protein [Synergistaceae bacterium]|jgi:quercetin dioxygenase-like cupin family protein|nr:cupin domain-containing protein [Synergistaceae bacterium]